METGKVRGLKQCSTSRGVFSILAVDHRQNLRKAINPDHPGRVSDASLTQFKLEVVRRVAPAASAVLLDPEYGAEQSIATHSLPGKTGLVCALEATGYSGEPSARAGKVLEGWNTKRVKRMGANAIKLLVYYHPASSTASQIEELVEKVAGDCADEQIPLFLEVLTYSPDPQIKKLSSTARRHAVIESAKRLVVPGVDVYKAEFPVDISSEGDEKVWAEACGELSAACPVPWVLLSASAEYKTYLQMVTVACQSGAAGVAAGRAVWQEATQLDGIKRKQFLEEVAVDRMQRLTALCDALARPWMEFYAADRSSSSSY